MWTWEEGHGGAFTPKLENWILERYSMRILKSDAELIYVLCFRYKGQAKHVQAPKICDVLINRCLPVLHQSGVQHVIDLYSLLVAAKSHIKSLQEEDLRSACQWLHMLGVVAMYDSESLDVKNLSSHSVFKMPTDATHSNSFRNSEDCPRDFHTLDHSSRSSYSELSDALPKLLPSLSPRTNNQCRIVLCPSWFNRHVLTPLLAFSASLSEDQSFRQPWVDSEYAFSENQLKDFLSSVSPPLAMTVADLVSILQTQSLSVRLPTSPLSIFIPSRVRGNKFQWLSRRAVSAIPLSQYSNRREDMGIFGAIGRRIQSAFPYILPPTTMYCVQSHMVRAWVENYSASWKGFAVKCWDRGLGITIESEGGIVCVLIETTLNYLHHEWSQDSNTVIDILVWGEGSCNSEHMYNILTTMVEISLGAVREVFIGALRSCRGSSESLSAFSCEWIRVVMLRPGCILHTLADSPSSRDCGVCEDSYSDQDKDAPVAVLCHHLQPRLTVDQVCRGYILNRSPGNGKGMLRSVFSAIEHSFLGQGFTPSATMGSPSRLVKYQGSSEESRESAEMTVDFDDIGMRSVPTMASE